MALGIQMTGSPLYVGEGQTRAGVIRALFNLERTAALLKKRRKDPAKASVILDRLVADDAAAGHKWNTYELSQAYNRILDKFPWPT